MKKKRCKCCKKMLKVYFANTKYCSACSSYTKELRMKLSYYKRSYKRLNKIFYGQERGSERVR